ncbi:RHS repeat protein [Noviherbaspirillum cavernae]|uniref:RHS repeat protein n=1 Tax=Noviherbaspirillum cavernae TaxID=2320862 RepID=A0A418WYX4_9BURK|nr:RHS repeat protein [Noviherbaspirillum cavernae]RJG05285.1 RHS repeat protein [Noviherbaspirillum cavernae]
MNRHPLMYLTAAAVLTGVTGTAAGQAPQNTTYSYQYDAVGNLTRITDPLGHVTDQGWDALNRLKQKQQPAPTTGAPRPTVNYSYDGLDQLISVTDPRNLVTSYTIDGLGNQTGVVSPDTGNASRTYDEAGNLKTSTDARAQTTSYQYDALNRVTRIAYADGNAVDYTYDQGANGIGRLTQIAEAAGTTRYAYDQKGRVTLETRTIGGMAYATAYSYDSAGRLSGITYPSGRMLAYIRDGAGRIAQIDTTREGVTATLARQVTYQPFGGVRSFVNGANVTVTRSHDLDGRITGYSLGARTATVTYDPASRIGSIGDAANPDSVRHYAYDDLDRLASYQSQNGSISYGYDPVGNRTSRVIGASVTNYSYAPTSNRLTRVSAGQTNDVVTDANGSITNNGANQFAHDARGRMVSAVTAQGTVHYKINALGQRVQKITPTEAIVYHYDTGGKLIGESTADGIFRKDYVYLNDIPVAVLK